MTTLEALRCECGELATGTCWEVNAKPPLSPCLKPLCRADCLKHRHQPNTMGFITITVTGSYSGFEPDSGGLREFLICLWRHYAWSPRQKAQYVWDDVIRNMQPQAPLPDFFFVVGRRTFVSRNGDPQVKEE